MVCGSAFWVWGLGDRVCGLEFGGLDVGVRVWSREAEAVLGRGWTGTISRLNCTNVWGFGFRVQKLVIWVVFFGVRVCGLGFRARIWVAGWGLVCRGWGLGSVVGGLCVGAGVSGHLVSTNVYEQIE